MQQSKVGSLIESGMNIGIGYVIAIFTQLAIFPIFDIQVSFGENLTIAGIFTGISLIRSYVIRRWFNARLHRASLKIAGVK